MPNVFGREASSDRLRCILAFLEGLGDIDLRRVFTSLLVAEISSVAASAQASWVEWKILESSVWPGPSGASFVDSNRALSKGTVISLSFWYHVW